MMMNDFGVPMTDADINMTANPAKAMMQQTMEVSGLENSWAWLAPVIGGAVGLYGAKKSSDAAKHCLLYTSPSPRDKRQSRMPSSA